MAEKAIVQLKISGRKESRDIEIPLDITATEFIQALNSAYSLEIPLNRLSTCYLKAEDPVVLIRGEKKLADFGIHHGTKITFDCWR